MDVGSPSFISSIQNLSSCPCDLHPHVSHFQLQAFNQTLTINICNLPLVPSWILAVALGLSFGWKLFALGREVTGSLAYSITYFMYAVMITSGLVVHCLFLVECAAQNSSQLYLDFAKVDASLTSCIAINFAFCGLVDLKLVSERSSVTWMTMVSSYGLLFYAYFTSVASTLDLYFNSVLLGCSFYMLTQLIRLIANWSHADWSEISFLIGAGLVGGASLLAIREEYCWLCRTLGPWSIEGLWYYSSDVAMFLLGVYILKSRSRIHYSYH